MTRKNFLQSLLAGSAGMAFCPDYISGMLPDNKAGKPQKKKRIHTVTGTIDSQSMGLTLPHEHIMCDFIGADKVSKDRYNPDEIVEAMLPYVEEIKKLGVKTFIDCTPAYIGRDPEILAALSKAAGITIITNTGFYKEPYLPSYTWELSADELAGSIIEEKLAGW